MSEASPGRINAPYMVNKLFRCWARATRGCDQSAAFWRLRRLRCARQVLGREIGKIAAPIFLVIAAELEQIVPAKNSSRVHVVEDEPHCIIADWMQLQDLDILLTGNRSPLTRGMSLNFGA